MAGTPITCNPSRVIFMNLKWLYLCSTWPSSSNLLNAWILFGLPFSTITSWSGKCQSNHLTFTYLLCRCILDIIWQIMKLIVGRFCVFRTMMIMLTLPGSLAWSTKRVLRSMMVCTLCCRGCLDIFVAGPDKHLFAFAMPRFHIGWLESDCHALWWLVDAFLRSLHFLHQIHVVRCLSGCAPWVLYPYLFEILHWHKEYQ